MPEPLDRHELAHMKCGTPGCNADHGDLVLRARCHPDRGVEVSHQNGILVIRCMRCQELVAEVIVGHRQ